MDWVIDETQLELIKDALFEIQEFAGYATYAHDNFDRDLTGGHWRYPDVNSFDILRDLGLARNTFRKAELHPNLLLACRLAIITESMRDVNTPSIQERWDAMVEGIELGTLN